MIATNDLISKLKDPSRAEWSVALRFALYNFLYGKMIPIRVIAGLFGESRGSIYYGVNKHKMRLNIKDNIATMANNEIAEHRVSVKPVLVEINDTYVKNNGYVLVVDDIIM